MKFRFTVTAFVDRRTRLGVVGSTIELGLWKVASCVPLLPLHVNVDAYEPSAWSGVVHIDIGAVGSSTPDIEYKFIRWTVPEELPTTDPTTQFPLDNDLSFPVPVVRMGHSFSPPEEDTDVTWEGAGAAENRVLRFQRNPETVYSVTPHSLVRVFSPEEDTVEENVYALPVYELRDPNVVLTEKSHTTRSYLRIKDALLMHYNRVLNRVVVGTCPRKKEHILYLMEHESISDIINLQSPEDIPNNFPLENFEGDRTPDAVAELYESLGLRYVWFPMEDMSSSARARGVAQATVLLASLLKRKGCTGVYVHCNAGVGRSIACAAGLIHCVMGAPIRLTNILINARRPVGYFDEDAVRKAASDFEFKFSGIAPALHPSIERQFSL